MSLVGTSSALSPVQIWPNILCLCRRRTRYNRRERAQTVDASESFKDCCTETELPHCSEH